MGKVDPVTFEEIVFGERWTSIYNKWPTKDDPATYEFNSAII